MSFKKILTGKFLLAVVAAFALTGVLLFPFSGGQKTPATTSSPIISSRASAVKNPLPRKVLDQWLQRVAASSAGQFDALIREAMRISDPDARRRIVGALAVRWINTDMSGFIEFMDQTEASDQGGESFWNILAPALFASLPSIDDQAASSGDLREVILRLLNFYAGVDPRAALSWARQWTLDETLNASLAAIVPEIAKSDPKEADTILKSIRQPLRRIEAVAGIAEVRARENPAEAVAWSKSLAATAERPYAMQSALTEIASTYPALAAREYVAYRGTLEAEFSAQVEADRVAMGLDAESAKNIDFNDPESLAARESGTAVPIQSGGVEVLTRAAAAIASRLAVEDPDAAIAWVRKLSDGGSKSDALAAAMASWAEADPTQALESYRKNFAGNPNPVEGIFNSWAGRDPQAAAIEAVQMKSRAERESAVRGVISGWVENSDENAAAKWVDSLPAGSLRDAAAREFVNATSGEQPFSAWGRAEVIQEPEERLRSMKKALSAMLIQDPQQAKAILAGAKLPEKDRKDLTELVMGVLPSNQR